MAYPRWSVTHLTRCRSATSSGGSGVQAVLRQFGTGWAPGCERKESEERFNDGHAKGMHTKQERRC